MNSTNKIIMNLQYNRKVSVTWKWIQKLLAYDHKPSIVDEQFKKIGETQREDVRMTKLKYNHISYLYNSVLPKIGCITENTIPYFIVMMHLKVCFPQISFVLFIKEITIYKRNKN